MLGKYPISSADRLLMRLAHSITSGQRVTFLVGSGLTCPSSDGRERGVPSAAEMVKRARALFPVESEVMLFDDVVGAAPQGRKYQAAMQFVIECRGQSTLNNLIRNAVLESRFAPSVDLPLDVIERDINGWFLRPGVAALGQLVRNHDTVFQRPILTSNFDPLLEIAIRRAGRGALSINLPNDGNFSGLVVNDNIAQVVHFHGFWSEGDTLHTPDRLTRARPLLAGNLRKLLQETVLVVIGYGGWNDVFTDSLVKAVSEQSQVIDVLWTFFSADPTYILEHHLDLLKSFESLPGQRIVAYAGVDCHELFPKLLRKLERPDTPLGVNLTVIDPFPPNSFAMRGTASPPATDAWVGREPELRDLLKANRSVLALHGLGGFGKSSLAARYVAEREKQRDVEAWYWADCREQGNTIQMHLIQVLEFLTKGQVTAVSLQKASDKDILDLFFERLGEHRVLVVFDNVDHYVDLETQKAIGMLNVLIEQAIASTHAAQLVLTSRPTLHYESDRFLGLTVAGLGAEEIDELFRLRGAEWDAAHKPEQICTVQKITQGSALHLNLIASQVAKQKITLVALLDRIQAGTAPEAEDRILAEIWGTLKQEHQQVLRLLAELPHPESEQRVATCLSGWMNFNRFGKAIRVLKSLNLIVVKPSGESVEAIELHPLVRSFIRRRYPKDEQKPIVDQVIDFFDRMIARFHGRPEMGTITVLGNWIAKIEVCLDNGRHSEAVITLSDIHRTLMSRGFIEEFLRLGTLVLEQYQIRDDPAELKKYDLVAERFVDALGDLGRYAEADQWIERLSKTVAGKSARYIWLCNVRSYAFWIRGQFDDARKWATEGVQLKSSSKIDTEYDCGHNLALARRDSGELDAALGYFLSGEKLDAVLTPQHLDSPRGGPFYGNIGRCLQFLGRFEDALICLKKSAFLLEKSHDDSNVLLNRGFAARWLGEVLSKEKSFDHAYLAFRSAFAKWKIVSPDRARQALRDANSVVENLSDSSLETCGDWECEEMFRNWLKV